MFLTIAAATALATTFQPIEDRPGATVLAARAKDDRLCVRLAERQREGTLRWTGCFPPDRAGIEAVYIDRFCSDGGALIGVAPPRTAKLNLRLEGYRGDRVIRVKTLRLPAKLRAGGRRAFVTRRLLNGEEGYVTAYDAAGAQIARSHFFGPPKPQCAQLPERR